MATGTAYLGRSNRIGLILDDDKDTPLDAVTRCHFIADGETYDSYIHPDVVDITRLVADRKVILSLGDTNITEGEHTFTLVLFDQNSPEGEVWQHSKDKSALKVRVIEGD